MIDLENQMITVQGKTEPLTHWDIFFVTLEGLFDSWCDAKESAERMNQDVKSIIPIPVALSENLYEPFLNQGVYIESGELDAQTTFPATGTNVQSEET